MPPEVQQFGKILVLIGVLIAVIGVLFLFGDKIPFIGRLPGDIMIRGKNFNFYFPIATSILLSIIISLILYFFRK